MKSTSPLGKGLLARFQELKVGQPCSFPSILPGISNESCQAFLTEANFDNSLLKGYWAFSIYWHGCHTADVTAEVIDGELTLEVL